MEPELSFPIGRFAPPSEISKAELETYIVRIAALPENLNKAVTGLNDEQLDTPYRPGGWTVRQVVHHIPDSHVNSYMRFKLALTEDNPVIKPYDEGAWAELDYQKNLPIQVSLNLLKALHARWVVLLNRLTAADLEKCYIHPEDGKTYSLRLGIALYAWHGDHHVAHIEALKKRLGW